MTNRVRVKRGCQWQMGTDPQETRLKIEESQLWQQDRWKAVWVAVWWGAPSGEVNQVRGRYKGRVLVKGRSSPSYIFPLQMIWAEELCRMERMRKMRDCQRFDIWQNVNNQHKYQIFEQVLNIWQNANNEHNSLAGARFRMGCVQLGQNSFVCSKHFSQFGICKMLDALLHSSWCELCALLAEGSQLSIWINTLSLSLSGNNAMLARWLLCFCKSMRVWAFSQAQLLALISEVAHRDLDSHHPYLGTKECPS